MANEQPRANDGTEQGLNDKSHKWVIADVLGNTKNVVAAVTGVVIVMIGFAKATYDGYAWWVELPRSPIERENVELFKAHFKEPPVLSQPVAVEPSSTGAATLVVDVYKNGDLFVLYGKNSRWLPMPREKGKSLASIIVPDAMAEESPGSLGPDKYSQKWHESASGTVVRERVYNDGTRESLEIDPRSGSVVGRSESQKPLSGQERQAIEKSGSSNRAPVELDRKGGDK